MSIKLKDLSTGFCRRFRPETFSFRDLPKNATVWYTDEEDDKVLVESPADLELALSENTSRLTIFFRPASQSMDKTAQRGASSKTKSKVREVAIRHSNPDSPAKRRHDALLVLLEKGFSSSPRVHHLLDHYDNEVDPVIRILSSEGDSEETRAAQRIQHLNSAYAALLSEGFDNIRQISACMAKYSDLNEVRRELQKAREQEIDWAKRYLSSGEHKGCYNF